MRIESGGQLRPFAETLLTATRVGVDLNRDIVQQLRERFPDAGQDRGAIAGEQEKNRDPWDTAMRIDHVLASLTFEVGNLPAGWEELAAAIG